MRPISRVKNGVRYDLKPAANGIFYIYWSESRRSKRESTRSKVLATADAYFDEWLSGTGEVGQSLTCTEIWDLKYAGNERTRFAWANLAPTFGHRRPLDVTQETVNRYMADRRAGRIGRCAARPSTLRFELACLYASWNAAVKSRALTSADLPALAPPPPGSPPRERWLTEDEIGRVLAVAGGGHRLTRVERFLWIALDACSRRTAIQELRWDTGQIDFEIGVIHFNPPGREQTRKKRASVPMSNRLRLVLERAYEERTGPWVLDSPAQINHPLRRVVAASGVAGVTPHVLRHTAATHMARRGVSLWIIAKLLGNTVEQVEKVYAKYAPDFGRDAVELIGSAPVRPRLVE